MHNWIGSFAPEKAHTLSVGGSISETCPNRRSLQGFVAYSSVTEVTWENRHYGRDYTTPHKVRLQITSARRYVCSLWGCTISHLSLHLCSILGQSDMLLEDNNRHTSRTHTPVDGIPPACENEQHVLETWIHLMYLLVWWATENIEQMRPVDISVVNQLVE